MPERARHRPLWPRLAVAASVVVALACGAAYYEHRMSRERMAQFEGSYIVRNGQKITDLKEIMPELRQTLIRAEQKQLRIERLLDGACQDEEELPTI